MKKNLSEILYPQRGFLIPFLSLILIGFSMMLYQSKSELFIFTNNYHNPFFDDFFKLVTLLGDGMVCVFVVLLLLFFKFRYAVLAALAFIYSSLVIQILKHLFNAPRPIKYFENIAPIHTIPGYPIHQWNSFPSGHTASIFTLAVILTCLISNKLRHWIILPLAMLTAFSRVYLAQHFMEDIIAGAIIAVILTFHLIWFLENTKCYHSSSLERRIKIFS